MKKLVCTIGTGNYKETNYYFGERRKLTNLAPVAIGCCVADPQEELELVALLTEEAHQSKHEQDLKAAAGAQGWTYAPVEIPDGKSEGELWRIFEAMGEQLHKGDELILDLTHGFRHIPALLLSAAQYYTSRKGISLLGIYYDAWEARDKENISPIFDLTPLVDLPEWSYGVRLLSEYQLPGPLGRMLDRIQRRSQTDPGAERRYSTLQKLSRHLKDLEAPLISGLPLEAGIAANESLKSAERAGEELDYLPPMREPWRELKAQLEGFELEGKKSDASLTLDELRRQIQLVEEYLKVSNLWAAVNVMRELVVSAVIFHSMNADFWLTRTLRESTGRKLGTLVKFNDPENGLREALTDSQRELAEIWNPLGDLRNAMAHAGMRENNIKFDTQKFEELHRKISERLDSPQHWDTGIQRTANERWLISPLGTSPGALYTALLETEPQRLLLITSQQGRELVDEILQQADREDLEPEYATLDDPFNGFTEAKVVIRDIQSRYARDWVTASEVTVNRTGGTTCLGWVAERLETDMRSRLGMEPQTIACIDRRSPEEQRRNPYVEGEAIAID